MKYSKRFEEDYLFYTSNLDNFCFAPLDVKSKYKLINSEDGETAKYCFYKFDSEGRVIPCREIELLEKLLITKASVNFHIKLYADDRAKG